MTYWNELNKTLSDGQSTNVTSGLCSGTYTRRGEAGFWTNLQHPKGEGKWALNELCKTLASR